ncbi:type II secretion system F family protein [Agathobaculum sp. NTUH-O15-33]|uniref:type II secretion system F family protein n=1 Tax=Agathobaculum sp. NTUH-O15-33 TaxID=3079302 RepID=UPI002958BC04|nr:type II secretion system F family protein [Agathobaculum sp. NTUH-O15-33]WNX86676.1 type II secretion system F family protein [Agathobaculum sp. NTUH-O15-33]
MEAYDEFDAVSRIKATECPIVLSIAEVQEGKGNILTRDIGGPKKIKEKQLALVCSQFSIIISAGLPMVRSVELVADQTTDKTLHKLLKQVAGDVAAGNSLADSFENKGGKQLPITFIETIRAGEESGTLEESFRKLFVYFEKSAKTRAKVTSALIYPAFLCVLSVVVVAIMMVKVIPMFTEMFASMNADLPPMTAIIIAASNFMVHYWLILLLIVVVLIFALKFWSKSPNGMKFFAVLKLKLPLVGRVQRMNAASQFANTMSTILAAGMPMTRTIQITAKVLDNYVIGMQVGDMVGGVEEGIRLGQCVKQCPWFPPLLTEMTGVGEETGSLENTLTIIGDYYDNEVNLAVERALSMLEPIIICGIAVIVVIVVLGFYLPMFSMYNNMA